MADGTTTLGEKIVAAARMAAAAHLAQSLSAHLEHGQQAAAGGAGLVFTDETLPVAMDRPFRSSRPAGGGAV